MASSKPFPISTQPIPHQFADDGLRTVELSIWSDGIKYSQTLDVLVENADPQLSPFTVTTTPLVEGTAIVVSANVFDPGSEDSLTVTVSWGDGTSSVHDFVPGTQAIELNHVYENDGDYIIDAAMSDDNNGLSAPTGAFVQIGNAAPEVLIFPNRSSILEGDSITLDGIIEDLGINDTYNVTIDWGDGSPPTVISNVGNSFQATHQYVDDRPTMTTKDVYEVSVSVVDVADSASRGTATTSIEVGNISPQLNELDGTSPRLPLDPVKVGQSVSLTGLFTEQGVADTVAAVVDWGDGSTGNAAVNYTSPVGGELLTTYSYAAAGQYVIKVHLIDDDGGVSNSIESTIQVDPADTQPPILNRFQRHTPDDSLTNEDTLVFRAEFSEAVQNVDAVDFILSGGSTAAVTAVSSVADSNNTVFELTVSGGNLASFDGSVGINLATTQDITDAAGNALPGAEPAIDELFLVDNQPPKVASVVIDDGTDQRSMVRSITVVFDSPILFDEGAFDLRTSSGEVITVATDIAPGQSTDQVVLTFPTSSGGSLADGNYRLTILPAHLRDAAGNALDGNGDGIAGDARVDDFFRFFGDYDGDRDVDAADYLFFRRTYRRTSGDVFFNDAFDQDGDGDVDALDYLGFRRNYRRQLN